MSAQRNSAFPRYYPVSLDLRGRRAVVVGGGALAEGKVVDLLAAECRVVVVAPHLTRALRSLVERGEIGHHARDYRRGDLERAHLAFAALEASEPAQQSGIRPEHDAALSRSALHDAMWQEAEERGVLLNAVDDARHCHFIAPAIHRDGPISIAVSTSGASPALAVRVRDEIRRTVGPEYATLATILGDLRERVARSIPDVASRRALWQRVVESEVLDLLKHGDDLTAHARIGQLLFADARPRPNAPASPPDVGSSGANAAGKVYLVGAGPGAPGLITVRGLHALTRADAVVYDRLVDPRLLSAAPSRARRVFVGKRAGHASITQNEINALLIRLARDGLVVVRLKGGDPFVFGRGGEECQALRDAGVRYAVIPGVTSAVAAPGAAGIPVTHRGRAGAFAVVSARRSTSGVTRDIDWAPLARMPTLVVLMGRRSLREVTAKLLEHGRDRDTPAAMISGATTRRQRTVVATLGTLAQRVADARLSSPATLVVGDVVALGRSKPPATPTTTSNGALPHE